MELVNIIEPIIEFDSWNIKRRSRKKEHSFIDRFILNASDLVKVLNPIIQISEDVKWWDRADEIKKRGLYVDYSDTLYQPRDVSKVDYLRAKLAVGQYRSL